MNDVRRAGAHDDGVFNECKISDQESCILFCFTFYHWYHAILYIASINSKDNDDDADDEDDDADADADDDDD